MRLLELQILTVTILLSSATAYIQHMSLNSKQLDGTWTVRNQNNSIKIPGRVPGGILSDLRAAGVITTDIHYRFNDLNLRWVSYDNWTYSTTFYVKGTTNKNISLVFHGIDTVSDIFLNEIHIGSTENMFLRYSFPITEVVQAGNNTLEVKIRSAVVAANSSYEKQAAKHIVPPKCVPSYYHGECHVNHLRKMQASFAWDWGPAFPSAAIWKSVEVIIYSEPYIEDVTAIIFDARDQWLVQVKAFMGGKFQTLPFPLRAHVESVNISSVEMEKDTQINNCYTASLSIPKDYVETWWPAGYGQQPLYKLIVTYGNHKIQSQVTKKIGFRSVMIIQEPIIKVNTSGLTFYFLVNGVPVFAKGSNWIPSNILSEMSYNETKIKYLLNSAKEANMNMLRVWGGGLYESDTFYDVADELGILIWQDFMFACSMYPASEEFLTNVRKEVEYQVKRLSHHPSIAIWSANNENEGALRDNWYGTYSNFSLYQTEYVQLYVDTVRQTAKLLDSERPFIISSPTNGLQSEAEGYIAKNPGSSLFGDVHYYNYMLDGWDPNIYPVPRFASEYGFQSLPSFYTIMSVSEPTDWSVDSDLMQNRQHHLGGYQEMVIEMNKHLPLPVNYSTEENFHTYIYFSQINQAMSTKVQTEHYRRWRSSLKESGEGYTMGALYWQLNDVWEAPSWSSIDFLDQWKMLHYYARDFFSDILVSAYVTSSGAVSVSVSSDKLEDIDTAFLSIHTYQWSNFTPLSTVSTNCSVKGQHSDSVFEQDLDTFLENAGCATSLSRKMCFLYLTLSDESENKISPDNFVFPSSFKEAVGLQVPNILVTEVHGPIQQQNNFNYTFEVKISTDSISLFVWLEVPNVFGHFSENGFLMVVPEKTVQFYTNRNINSDYLKKTITVTSMMNHAS
ncbi:beta-mannosidase isoform X2 [Schistocerca serialis cubense]|nr:beta-mannosidase isoform X2 [Schistocerca serialis cubense]